MPDEVFTVEIRFEMQNALTNLAEAGRSSTVLTDIVAQLRKELQILQQTGQAGTTALASFFGEKLVEGTDKARAAIETLKSSFRGLVDAGRTLEEIKAAMDLLSKPIVITVDGKQVKIPLGELQQSFGKEVAENLKVGVGVAIKELNNEMKALDAKFKESEAVARSYSEVARRGFGDPLISAQQFRAQVDLVKQQMLALQQTSKLSLNDVVQGFRMAEAAGRQFGSGVINQAAAELRNLGNAAKETSTQMSGLNQISTVFFGTTLGQLALGALRRLVSQFDELIQRGLEFSRTQFILATSIRALQRIGLDITFAEVNEQVERLANTFSFFTKRQIQQGVSQILLLTRNLKLTKEEMFDLTEATAALAIVTGKDFGEEGMLVARAIASGYTEALQRAGIEASRTKIQTEALALGIDKAFLAMTQAERAAVTLRLVLDQVGDIQEDVAQFQTTLAGKFGEANALIGEQADRLGSKLTPAYVFLVEKISVAFKGFLDVFSILQLAFLSFFSLLAGSAVGIAAYFESVKNGAALTLDELRDLTEETADELFKIWVDEFLEPTENAFKDTEIGVPEPDFDDAANELKEQAQELEKDVKDIIRDYNIGLRDATIDFFREGDDIELEFDRDSFDEQLEFQQDLAELSLETTNKISDKQDEFREKELKAERDFQEKLLKLRESFLFDLEDALRERDAKQVLRLIRQFNLRETQLHREFENEREERASAFADEIADIKLQQERKAAELQLEFEQRQAELELQREREYEDRMIAYRREIEDLQRRRDDRLAILKDGLKQELQMLVDYWSGVLSISAIGAVQLANIMRSIFGGTLGTGQAEGGSGGGAGGMGSGGSVQFAEGGTLIAKKPTVAVFGEKGAEVVSFKPVNRIGRDEGKVFGGFLPGSANGDGRMLIELLLSPDLEARIIDNTLGQVGDVIIRTMK